MLLLRVRCFRLRAPVSRCRCRLRSYAPILRSLFIRAYFPRHYFA